MSTLRAEAPLLHQSMSIQNRLECGFAGYVLLDVWKLLADRETKKRGLPKGSLWLAPQTQRNLQSVVQGMLVALLGKDEIGNPFKNGHHRMSELHIEEFFGRLRMRAHNSQFNVKQFWSASSAEAIRVSKQGMGKSDSSILSPPSDQQWYDASKRGYQAALKLAAWTSRVSPESLDALYRQHARGLIGAEDLESPIHMWERDEQEDWEDEGTEDARASCLGVLEKLREDTAASLRDTGDKMKPAGEPNVGESEAAELNAGEAETGGSDGKKEVPGDNLAFLKSLPEGQALREIFTADDDEEEPLMPSSRQESPMMFCNLWDALAACEDDSSEQKFDKIFRLLMYLRHWGGGMDRHFIPNPRAARKRSEHSKKHWYRCPDLHPIKGYSMCDHV